MIRIFAAVLAVALPGCASSLSGVGGTERYACRAPEGALCTSVSGVYANWANGMPRPAQPPATMPAATAPAAYGAAPLPPTSSTLPSASGTSIRSNSRVLRVWIAPWEDSDGDLHEEAYVHVLVDSGRWLIEHVRPVSGGRVDVAAPVPLAQEAAPAKTQTDQSPPMDRLPRAPGLAPSASDATPLEP